MPRVTALKINSVVSSYGHTFMYCGENEAFDGNVMGLYVDCLTCGAHYVLRATPDGLSDGDYFANNGDEPMECSRDTGMEHGPDGCAHDCNCILCC